MVCEACMNKAPFLWTYAEHFAGNPFSWPACHEKPRKPKMSDGARCPFKASDPCFFFFLVPPEVSVEKRGHKVAQNLQEENDTDYKNSRNKETSTNEEQSKQEVRSCFMKSKLAFWGLHTLLALIMIVSTKFSFHVSCCLQSKASNSLIVMKLGPYDCFQKKKDKKNKDLNHCTHLAYKQAEPALFPVGDKRRRKRQLFFPQWAHLHNDRSNCRVQENGEIY